jgi:hypothetical protein
MKTTFLKSAIPFAAVAMMGISGAFLITSMQSASKTAVPRQGFIDGPKGPCSVSVSCGTSGTICQANGVQAFGKNNNCTEILYMPQN